MGIPSTPMATNFYLDSSDSTGNFSTTAVERRAQIQAHARIVAAGDLVIVGEAAGWQGARQSGVAFTSPLMVGLPGTREPSATTVHRALTAHGLEDRTLLWNAFPLHPHELGLPATNRTPTRAELASGEAALREALRGRRVICVGAKATDSVGRVLGAAVPLARDMTGTETAIAIRHPSFGGVREFQTGFNQLVAAWRL